MAPHHNLLRLSTCRDLATHIDGFIATTAHTLVVGSEEKVTGQKADLLQAALTALEAAIRLVRPGSRSADVGPILQKVCPVQAIPCLQRAISQLGQRARLAHAGLKAARPQLARVSLVCFGRRAPHTNVHLASGCRQPGIWEPGIAAPVAASALHPVDNCLHFHPCAFVGMHITMRALCRSWRPTAAPWSRAC